MNQDWPDPALARLFERQRAADQRTAPSFARCCAPSRPRHHRLRVGRLAHVLAFSAGSVLAVSPLWLRPPSDEWPVSAEARVSVFSISTWQAPTDALLQDLSGVPLSGSAVTWTDALIPLAGVADPGPGSTSPATTILKTH